MNTNTEQRDQPKNEVTAVTLQWTTALGAALKAASLDYTWEKGRNNNVGRMVVKTNGAPAEPAIFYPIDFNRKMVIRNGERVITVSIEAYNPSGKLHVHILKFTPENVAKIANYAKDTLDLKTAKAKQEIDRTIRSHKARDLYQKELGSFEFPAWAVALLNVDRDEDLGTYNLSLREHRSDFPLRRLSAEQVKALVQFIQAGCTPSAYWALWIPASVPVPPELVNDPGSTDKIKMLLLAIPGDHYSNPVRGWFYGGTLNEFRMEGSPQAAKPSHWTPMPELPVQRPSFPENKTLKEAARE